MKKDKKKKGSIRKNKVVCKNKCNDFWIDPSGHGCAENCKYK